jgi:hypothetical protein
VYINFFRLGFSIGNYYKRSFGKRRFPARKACVVFTARVSDFDYAAYVTAKSVRPVILAGRSKRMAVAAFIGHAMAAEKRLIPDDGVRRRIRIDTIP